MMLPLTQITRPIRSVGFPALSRAIADAKTYRDTFLATSKFLSLVVGCLVALMIVFGDVLITAILGEQWTEAGRLFMLLGIGAFLLPLWNLTGLLFLTQGRATEHLFFHLFDLVLKVTSVLVGLTWGIEGVAIAVGVRYYLGAPILFWMVGSSGPVSAMDLYKNLILPAAVDVLLLGALFGARTIFEGVLGPYAVLALSVALTGGIMFSIFRWTGPGRHCLAAVRGLSAAKVTVQSATRAEGENEAK